ncbi:MAG: hypothetical protein U5J95_12445 [Balneolaceae bacterium]|nr:hypothetical protein [Balneolaceae bacterium]
MRKINSMVEFKQIVGRGTRLSMEKTISPFTISTGMPTPSSTILIGMANR